ncbi:MAG: phosphodiesterase [Clostridia bacterium]|nr:phosphodiesterase [Clostridia bacterium]
MKLLIASDIHGDAVCASELLEVFENEKCDKMLLLGDLLYHGPRNDLPSAYAPKRVIELLNGYRNKIIAVRGNCDTEVDQMVLSFPILADYAYLCLDGISVIAHHGHRFGLDNPPEMCASELLLCGHTHVQCIRPLGEGKYYLNPGSVTLPKENNPRTYMIYENRSFKIVDFNGNVINSLKI